MSRYRSVPALLAGAVLFLTAGLACSSGDDAPETSTTGGGTGASAAAAPVATPDVRPAIGLTDGTDPTAEERPDPFKLTQELDLSITFTSPVFNEGRRIPKKHTCTKQSNTDPNISPPLQWEGVPETAQSLVLVMYSFETPDYEPRFHWLMWNMPPVDTELGEGIEQTNVLPDGTTQGTNDVGTLGYVGPCPPPQVPPNYDTSTRTLGTGKQQPIEKYHFKLFALDGMLVLPAGATKTELLAAVEGHAIAGGELVGERQGQLIFRE